VPGPIRIVSVGRPLRGPYEGLVEEYARRARRFAPVELVRLRASKARRGSARRRAEAGALAGGASAGVTVALDAGGSPLGSLEFRDALLRWRERGGATFLLGGPDGLDASALDGADERISLGPLTLSHDLALLVLVEQVYRALADAAGHPFAGH
jgi:23S rRNA (pseudouridine1915-N3)-methyltransferase